MTAIYAAILWFLSALGTDARICADLLDGGAALICAAPHSPVASHAKGGAPEGPEYEHNWGMSVDMVDTTSDEPISNGF